MIRDMRCPPRGRRSLIVAIALLLPFLSVLDGVAKERLQRRFDLERGLPFSEVPSVKQDTRGFIWIATSGGLFRYDGVDLRPWPREPFRDVVKAVSAGPGGEVVFLDYTGIVHEVVGDGIRSMKGPGGSPIRASSAPIWDSSRELWLLARDRLWCHAPGGEWREISLAPVGSERPYVLEASEDGLPLLITDQAIWSVDPSGSFVRRFSIPGVGKALVRHDGSAVTLQRDGGVLELRGGTKRELFRLAERPIDIVQRGATLWVAYDGNLVALSEGEPPEVLGPTENVPSGGPLLVDQEGSLWVGTFRGLLQYPAPDSVALGASDGMTSTSSRRLAPSPEGIWVDSWGGLTLLRRREGSWRPERLPGTATSAVCVGTDGTLWAGYRGGFLEHRDGRTVLHPMPRLREVEDCSPGAAGRVWMTSDLGLFLAGGNVRGSSPTSVSGPLRDGREQVADHVLEDSNGRLWVSEGEETCHTDSRAAASGDPVRWVCSRAEGSGEILGLAEISPGTLWSSTLRGGVYRFDARERWEQIPGSRRLPARVVRRVRPSPSGGAWIISFGTILRAVERPGSADGWEIVERPSPWQGLMVNDAEDILEEPSGDLWITSLAGLIHIPREVRRSGTPVPRVELVEALVDGQPLAWQGGVSLPYRRNRIELRFAGLSYRDPGLLRYQVRLRPDAPWIDAPGRPAFQFVDLPPGAYQAEVRASLDGSRWSGEAATLAFTVRPPFWRTWWFTSLAILTIFSAVYVLYRYRLAQLLKLERMRTRIAADLHDDIGASLSRIAIQSELVRRPVVIPPADAERLLSEIGESARSLVDSMSDIVWSIDPGRDDLGSLVARVRQFALGILEPGGIALELSAPETAANAKLAPEVRRHLYLFFKEAINNIARHAACRNVSISMRLEGGRLDVEVKDDGRGFDGAEGAVSSSPGRGGHGLPSMRVRAEHLGGILTVASTPGAGTTLRLSCAIEHGTA